MTKLPRTPEYNFSPHPEKRGAPGALVFIMAGLCAVLVALIVGHAIATAVVRVVT